MSNVQPIKTAVQITGVKFSDGSSRTFRYSNLGFNANINNEGIYYYSPLISSNIITDIEAFKRSTIGAITLSNNGDLDELNNYSFDGRDIQIFISMEESPNPVSFYSLFKGKIETLNIKRTTVEIRSTSPFNVFDVPLNPKTFQGSAVAYEGSDDLINKTKPRVIGKAFNITPVLIKSSALIYGCNWDKDGNRSPLLSIDAVKDGGAVMTLDTSVGSSGDFATTALMDAIGNKPDPLKYTTCVAEGTIKLGSSPVFDITMDVEQETNNYFEWMQQLSTELSLNGFVVHSSTPLFTIGGYFESATNYVEADRYLANDIDVANWFGLDGRINSARVRDDGVATPVVNFVKAGLTPDGSTDIIAFEIIRDRYESPPKQIQSAYKRNYTIQSEESLAGSLTEDQKTELKEEYRYKLDTNSCITDPYALDKQISITNALDDPTEAQTEIEDYLLARSKTRDYLSVKCPILASNNEIVLGIMIDGSSNYINISSTDVLISSTAYNISHANSNYTGQRMLRIGDIVTLKDDRIDYTSDRFVVYGININTRTMMATYKIFGLRSASTCT